MLIPFDMIAVMLFIGYYAATPSPGAPTLAASSLALFFGVLLTAAGAALANRLAVRKLRDRRLDYAGRRAFAARVDTAIRLILVGLEAGALEATAFPWAAARAGGWNPVSESLAVQLLALVPYLLFFAAAWLPMYSFHRETNFGTWTRASFLVHKARYNLFMLLAWLPFAILADWLSEFVMSLPLLFLLAAWSFPWVLARIWGCKPLADEKILDTVRRLEREAGARFSRVFLWEPGGGVQNAAAVGIFRPFRYLFLTPALIANMKEAELEAVILHELGHVRHRHLLFYLFTSLAGINLAVILGALAPMAGATEQFVITLLLVLAYFRLAFGWLSRNMERQADLFSLRYSRSPGDLPNALEKLAISAGNIRQAASWHHLGIAQRVAYLRRAHREPRLTVRHNAHVRRIMSFGYGFSLAVIVGLVWLYHAEVSVSAARARPGDGGVEAHWRRVMQIMPGNSTAPLELAYHLAGDPGSRDKAAELASRARELACGSEERTAAAKLAEELAESPQ